MTKLKDDEQISEPHFQKKVNNKILHTYFENPKHIAGTLKIVTERTRNHIEQTRLRLS